MALKVKVENDDENNVADIPLFATKEDMKKNIELDEKLTIKVEVKDDES